MNSRYLRRPIKDRTHSPGTLVYTGPPRDHAVRVRLVRYDAQGVEEEVVPAADFGAAHLTAVPGKTLWVDVEGVHDLGVLAALVEGLGIPPLAAQDLPAVGQRPGVQDHGDLLQVTLRRLSLPPGQERIEGEQVSILLWEDGVLSITETPGDPFAPILDRIHRGRGPIRGAGADYLVYALLDALVTGYDEVLLELAHRTEALEDQELEEVSSDFSTEIRAVYKEAVLFRRALLPLRNVAEALDRGGVSWVAPENRPFFHDLQEHLAQLVEAADAVKEGLNSLRDSYITFVNQRATDITMVLTLVATIFIPLTFLAGIYGMNFQHMPELAWPWAYPALLLAMAAVGIGLVFFFKRKGWM